MTVEQLILELAKHPREEEVWVMTRMYPGLPVTSVSHNRDLEIVIIQNDD